MFVQEILFPTGNPPITKAPNFINLKYKIKESIILSMWVVISEAICLLSTVYLLRKFLFIKKLKIFLLISINFLAVAPVLIFFNLKINVTGCDFYLLNTISMAFLSPTAQAEDEIKKNTQLNKNTEEDSEFDCDSNYLLDLSEEQSIKNKRGEPSKFNEWLSGIIDGDGYFSMSKKGYVSLEITLQLRDRRVLYLIKQINWIYNFKLYLY